jgi:hypothetical protein
MEKSRKRRIALTASLCAIAVIGTAAAFLTSSDLAENNFTIGEVDIDIEEDFDENKTLAAGEIIDKEPWVKNTGTVNELIFVEVSVPCMDATFLTSDGQRIDPTGSASGAESYRQVEEIFNLIAAGGPAKEYIIQPEQLASGVTKNWELSYNASTPDSPGWVYLRQTESKAEKSGIQGIQNGTYDTYLLGYSAWVAPGDRTVPIFDDLQLRSIIDSDIAGRTIGQVQINAYAVQADALEISGLTGEGTADVPYVKSDLESIYNIIDNKNTAP